MALTLLGTLFEAQSTCGWNAICKCYRYFMPSAAESLLWHLLTKTFPHDHLDFENYSSIYIQKLVSKHWFIEDIIDWQTNYCCVCDALGRCLAYRSWFLNYPSMKGWKLCTEKFDIPSKSSRAYPTISDVPWKRTLETCTSNSIWLVLFIHKHHRASIRYRYLRNF